MTENNIGTGVLRTVAPYVVSTIVAAAVAIGLDVPAEVQEWLIGAIVLVGGTVWYSAFRWLETHVSPAFGWFLGSNKSPDGYSADLATPDAQAGAHASDAPVDEQPAVVIATENLDDAEVAEDEESDEELDGEELEEEPEEGGLGN